MRKYILIAAMVLISASAQAGVTMASNDEPVAAGQPKAAEAPKAEAPKADIPKADAPKFVERPAVDTTADQPKSDQVKPASDKKAEKPKRTRESTEARVIYELHRHGIYW